MDLISILPQLATQYPSIGTALLVIGALRLAFKPAMTAIEAYIKSTPSLEDDQAFEAIEASKPFKAVCWLLDLVASVKVGTQSPPKTP